MIDIGCGSGATLARIEDLLLEGSLKGLDLSLWGIDFSKEGIIVAEERTNKSQFVIGEFLDHSFDLNFDYALSIGVFEHFPKPVEALRKTRDILTSEGLAYFSVPVSDYLPELLGYDPGIPESFARHKRGKQLSWLLSKSTWREIIDAADLVVIKELPNMNLRSMTRWILARQDSFWAQNPVSLWKLDRLFYYTNFINYLRPKISGVKNIIPQQLRGYLRKYLSKFDLIKKV